jgi:hypothetical protein
VTDQLDSVGLDRDAAGLRWKSSAMLGIACGFRLASVAALVGLCESTWSDTAVADGAELTQLCLRRAERHLLPALDVGDVGSAGREKRRHRSERTDPDRPN